MTDKGKISRKGSLTKQKLNINNKQDLEKKHGKIDEVRKYKNDRYGAFFADGQFRWVSILNKESTTKKQCNCKAKNCKCAKGVCNCKAKNCKCGCAKGICSCNMKGGGKSIDLKTAVNLLRNYYSQKYN